MTESYEIYHFYKDLGICIRCHKNVAEPQKVMCWECIESESERRHNKRIEKNQEYKDKDNKKYRMLKEQGICTYCKHRKAAFGKTKCEYCLSKLRARRNARKCDIDRSERVAYGICYICGKADVIPGKGVCEKCYETRMESIEKIMYLPGGKHWKNDNKLVFKKSRKE